MSSLSVVVVGWSRLVGSIVGIVVRRGIVTIWISAVGVVAVLVVTVGIGPIASVVLNHSLFT
jgi:hypothetical protein